MLGKYADDGELQFTLPGVLKVLRISQHGNVAEIVGKFGGTDEVRNAEPTATAPLCPLKDRRTKAIVAMPANSLLLANFAAAA